MLTEISQTEKENTVWFQLYVESQNKQNKNRLIDTENKLIAARGVKKGEGNKRYKFLVIK